jgi:Ulp1 family protease
MHHPEFFVAITCYDSLKHAAKLIEERGIAADIVKKMNFFFKTFVLHDKASLRQSDTDVIQLAQYKACPMQLNGYDCGIFAVATVLHLLERIDLSSRSLTQVHVTKARSLLAKTL